MYPTQLLVLMLLITAGALAVQFRARTRRARRLRDLASRERMHYSPVDRFGLAPRVAKYFPSPGVADVRVADLLYRSDDGGHRYVFTVDYTRGVLGVKRRVRGVALMTEPKPVPGREVPPTIKLGDAARPIVGQYEALLRA
jgi:hypothetical protein